VDAIAKGESCPNAKSVVIAGPPSEGSGYDRCVTMLLISDLHGLVDGVTRGAMRVGGVDGLVRAVQEIKSLSGLVTHEEMYVFVAGDMIRQYSNRRITEANALEVWNLILTDLARDQKNPPPPGVPPPLPDAVTFGNHEIEFKDVPTQRLLSLHCHNLELNPTSDECTYECTYRKCRVHYNAVCEQVKNPGSATRVRFCGVTTGKPHPGSGAVINNDNVHAAAAECPRHWDAKNDNSSPRVLLAHYTSLPPKAFAAQAPSGYHVIFKAHDHNGGSNIPSDGQQFQLPIVAEPHANGRSVGVLKLWFADGSPGRAAFEQKGAYPPGTTTWSADKQLQEVQEQIVYPPNREPRLEFLPFGGASETDTLYLRRRAVQLGLRGMEFACQPNKQENHVFLMSATAIRDYCMVPGAGRLPNQANQIDTWDLKAVFGESIHRHRVIARTFAGNRARLIAALTQILGDQQQRLVPWEYTDMPRIFLRFGGSTHCVTLHDGHPKADSVSGKLCALGNEQLDLQDVLPDAELCATMPSWEAGLVEDLTHWHPLKTKQRVVLCQNGMHDIPIWECVERLLVQRGSPDLFHC